MVPVIEHDPEKWKPVFGKDHAPMKQLGRFCAGRHRSVNLAPPLAQSGQATAFSRRMRARVLPMPLPRSSFGAQSRHAATGGGTGFRLRSRSDKPRKEKGSGTPTDAHCMKPHQRMRPRAKRRALACRRSTTALAAATERHRSAPVHALSGTELGRDGRYPSPAVPVQRAFMSPQAGHSAGRAFWPGAARERG